MASRPTQTPRAAAGAPISSGVNAQIAETIRKSDKEAFLYPNIGVISTKMSRVPHSPISIHIARLVIGKPIRSFIVMFSGA
jgi:hypothetical protein